MRVTNNMLANQTLFNVRRSLSSFLKIQEEMTTGRRVSKPSDDPIAVQRGLEYRTTLDRIAQYQTNINLGSNLLGTYENSITDMSGLLKQASEIALAVSDDSNNSPEALPAFRNEVKSAIERLLQLSNTRLDGRRVFAGHRTQTDALTAGPNGVTYMGDFGAALIEIDDSTQIQLNINAADLLLKQITVIGENSDLNVGIDGATLLTELHNGSGVDLNSFTITDQNTGTVATVDLALPAPALTVDDVIARVNGALSASGITNLSAAVGSDGNIRLDSTPGAQIAGTTLLSNLNGGSGVQQTPGTIRVADDIGSIDFEINLSGAVTISDAISAINTGLTANGVNNVTAAINGAGTGIDITDSNGVPLNLTISDSAPLAQTAFDLGISGAVDPVLAGKDLNPVNNFIVAEGAGQTGVDLGLLGAFSVDFAGSNLDAMLNSATPVSRLNNALGFDLGSLKITQGENIVFVDLSGPSITTVSDVLTALNNSGLNIVASVNAQNSGIQISSTSTTESLIVENANTDVTASNLQLFGAADLMGAMLLLRNQLDPGAGNTANQVNIEKLMVTLDAGLDEILSARGAIGSKQVRLDATAVRLGSNEMENVRLLSEVEDADITELVTRLATHENNYQAGLIATAKIIQPSLMDFLR